MKKKSRYCEPTMRLHQLKTSGILQNSGNFNSNQKYSEQTINWGDSNGAKSMDFEEE